MDRDRANEEKEWDSSSEGSESEDDEDVILIPVKTDGSFVRVSVSELPDDANVILDILKAELAPLNIWLKIAVSVPFVFDELYHLRSEFRFSTSSKAKSSNSNKYSWRVRPKVCLPK